MFDLCSCERIQYSADIVVNSQSNLYLMKKVWAYEQFW